MRVPDVTGLDGTGRDGPLPPWEQRARRIAEAAARRPAASLRLVRAFLVVDAGAVLLAGLAGGVGVVVALTVWVLMAVWGVSSQFRTAALPPRFTEIYLQMWVAWALLHVLFLTNAVPRFVGQPAWIVPLALITPAPLLWAWLRLRRRPSRP